MKRLTVIIVALTCAGLVASAAPLRIDIAVGLDGAFTTMRWNPVTVTVHNDGPAVTGELLLEVREGYYGMNEQPDPIAFYRVATQLPPGVSTFLTGVILPLFPSSITARLFGPDGRVLHLRRQELRREQTVYNLVVVVTRRPDRLPRLNQAREHQVTLPPERLLPDMRVLSAADVIVLDDVRWDELDAQLRPRVLQWVGRSGLLVLTGEFARRNRDTAEVRQLSGVTITGDLTPIVPGEAALELAPGQRVLGARVLPALAAPETIVAAAGGRPLLIESAFGTGLVRTVLTDLAWLKLPSPGQEVLFGQAAWTGLLEGATSRRRAFREPVPTAVIPPELQTRHLRRPLAWYLGAFVVLVGVVNTLVLVLLRRKEWLLFTAPAAVAIFLIVAAIMAPLLHSRRPILSVATVGLASANRPGLALTRYVGVSSPRTGSQTVILDRPDALPEEFKQSDQFAKMVGPITYGASPGERLELQALPLPQWSMRGFLDSGYADIGTLRGALTVDAAGLSGTVENALGVDLRHCVLMHRWHHVAVGDLPRGQRQTVRLPLGPPALSEYSLARLGNQSVLKGWLDPILWSKELDGPDGDLLRSMNSLGVDPLPPVLIGWGDRPEPAPRLRENSYGFLSHHLYIFRLPVTATGPQVTIPVGAAFYRYTFDRLSAKAAAAAGISDLESERSAVHEFILPTGQPNLRHQRLAIQGHLRSDPTHSPKGNVLEAWDFQASKWVTVAEQLPQDFRQELPNPGRFIQSPRALITVRVRAPDDPSDPGTECTWIDLSYEGEVAPR